MIRPIMKDQFFLAQKSQPATKDDLAVAQDLLDTLAFHQNNCVGMAANMIGVRKRIIAVDVGGTHQLFFNPEILSGTDPFETQEGCLSLEGTRPTTRYRTIRLRYQDKKMKEKNAVFTGWTAQIIQHEIDHCNGIII